METLNYKNEIASTRLGCLGSSDGKMLMAIAEQECIPRSAYKRLAVCKGLIPQTEIPKTAAIQAGDDLEMMVYEHLKEKNPKFESNPLWVSKRYSKENVKLISHPDFVYKDEEKKVLNVYEMKATKYSVAQTRNIYKAQLYIHYILGKEIANDLGKDWQVKLYLVHYSTEGLDLTEGIDFDPSRLTVQNVKFFCSVFDAYKAMEYVSRFLEGFDEYYEGDEIDESLLPERVKNEIGQVADAILQIDALKKKIDEYRKSLYNFFVEKEILKINGDNFSFTVVKPTVVSSFDDKKYLEDLEKAHPRVAKKIREKYKKISNKAGYVKIDVKKK